MILLPEEKLQVLRLLDRVVKDGRVLWQLLLVKIATVASMSSTSRPNAIGSLRATGSGAELALCRLAPSTCRRFTILPHVNRSRSLNLLFLLLLGVILEAHLLLCVSVLSGLALLLLMIILFLVNTHPCTASFGGTLGPRCLLGQCLSFRIGIEGLLVLIGTIELRDLWRSMH